MASRDAGGALQVEGGGGGPRDHDRCRLVGRRGGGGQDGAARLERDDGGKPGHGDRRRRGPGAPSGEEHYRNRLDFGRELLESKLCDHNVELIVCVYRHHSVVALLGDPGKPDLQPNQTSWGASAFRLDSPFIAADDIARVRSTLPRGLRSQIGISRVSDWPYSGSVPSLTRTYDRTVFTPGVLRAAYKRFGLLLPDGSKPAMSGREVESARDKWSYDTNEEFLDALGEPHTRSYVIFCIGESNTGYHNARIVVDRFEARTTVTVEGEDRGHVLGMIEPFEDGRTRCRIPEPPTPPAEPPTVFIAHGRSSAWKTIRDELRKHGYAVEAYEEGARSGLTITELLGKMLGKSAFGVAVLTAEDEQADGGLRARQNVIHETGYLHGVLGVARVAILMESGVDQFTNIAGVQYIGITTSQPIVAMSDLLAHIRREFPQMPG